MGIPKLNERATYGAAAVGAGDVRVAMTTIDAHEPSSCACIRIDMKGFEGQVRQGARDGLLTCRPGLSVEAKRRPDTTAMPGMAAGQRLAVPLAFRVLLQA